MSDILIIAPTATYKRDPANVPIVDDIKDHTDSVNVKDNIPAMVPDASAIPEVKHVGPKHYYNMQAIHEGNEKVESERRLKWFQFEEYLKHGDTIYPDTGQSSNSRYFRGLSNCS